MTGYDYSCTEYCLYSPLPLSGVHLADLRYEGTRIKGPVTVLSLGFSKQMEGDH